MAKYLQEDIHAVCATLPCKAQVPHFLRTTDGRLYGNQVLPRKQEVLGQLTGNAVKFKKVV